MAKFFILALGFSLTGLGILAGSNVIIFMVMAVFIFIPLVFIVIDKFKQLDQLRDEESKPYLSVAYKKNLCRSDSEIARRERMRSEASLLQAELSRIKRTPEKMDRVSNMIKWKLKADKHHVLYSDLYEQISDEFKDDVDYFNVKQFEASIAPSLD